MPLKQSLHQHLSIDLPPIIRFSRFRLPAGRQGGETSPVQSYPRRRYRHPVKARVFQTATDLIWNNFDVHGVADTVGSRKKQDWEAGLRWIDKKGAMISTTDIVAFQLLKEAGTESYSRLSKFLKWKGYGA